MLKKRLHFDMPRESVTEILAGFPDRYRCHRTKKYKGKWQCRKKNTRIIIKKPKQNYG